MPFTRFPAALLGAALVLGGCGDGVHPLDDEPVVYDFSAVDAGFARFLDDSAVFDGISYTLVDAEQGTVHEGALGDHTLDIVVQLASTSKMPSVSLLMALHEDPALDYDVEEMIGRYLPWDGVYGDRTTVELVSNTSGIPGLGAITSEYLAAGHLCQFLGTVTLQECAETLYTNELPGTVAPSTEFNYGGTQWHLSGAVAENVSNSTWNQAFDAYIGEPCDLEVFTYGNMWSDITSFTGDPDGLTGQENAHIEGGAITNMQDYAKILLMHLRGGRCGDNQVLSQDAVEFMQVDRAGRFGTPYGMGWWILPGDDENNEVVYDPGAFGAVSWLDMGRGIGGYVGIDDYTMTNAGAVYGLVLDVIIPAQQAAVDAARGASAAD
ncbi:MAG: serine hydrolase [Halioglobus sp.]|nr:serine hydrolase [Halioglobus sp.]